MADRKKRSSGGRKARRNYWTKEREEKLKELFPVATWDELHKAFAGSTRAAINNKALRLRLKRPTRAQLAERIAVQNGGAASGKAMAAAKAPEPLTEERIARFMTHGRSVKEVASQFKIGEDEAAKRLEKGFKDYDLFLGPKNMAGEQTYVAVPKCGKPKKLAKAWSWMREPNGQPYGVVTFPENFRHKKIRVVPLDGIHFGSRDHDGPRFQAIVNKIEWEPNTFCYLNGDVLAELKGGKKEVRERRLIELSVEFADILRPIAHKILFAQQGCLEERTWRSQGFDPLAHLCRQLDIPYFTEPVYIDLNWGKHLFCLFTMHGFSTAQLKGSKINALRRPAQNLEYTHFIVGGHIGDSIWNRVVKVCRNPMSGQLEQREEFHVILGSFTKYLGTRSARRGYQPPSNESIVLYLYPNGEHHVKTEHGGES